MAKRKTNKKPKASIAEVDVDPTEDDGDADIGDVKSGEKKKFSKVSRGKTGVELRFHIKKTYHLLSKPQKYELTEWRKTRDAKQAQHGSGQGNKKKVKIGSSEVIAETETAEAAPADASSTTSSKMRSILRRIKHG